MKSLFDWWVSKTWILPKRPRRTTFAALGLLVLAVRLNAFAQTMPEETFRPQYHFTPLVNWMNDPNGLVYYQGEYHLFFQYNPAGITWGPEISWGHAVSTDLVHWTQLTVAISATTTIGIFSGSAVVDERNSSGFGTVDHPPLVAIYSGNYFAAGIDPNDGSTIPAATQVQNIAFSTDRGRTWTPYAMNPVINPIKDASIDSINFRDPKVFWYERTRNWIMVVALSWQRKVRFYSSLDLKTWRYLNEFGPANAVNGVWECPDLFELAIEDSNDRPNGQAHGQNNPQKKWVLVVNLNPGAIAGGSGAQYFIGDFDENRFAAGDIIDPSEPPAGTLFQDFEGDDTFTGIGWTATGDFVGKGPVVETGQTGFLGKQLVNTYFGNDSYEGTVTSPIFTIRYKYISLLVGGGSHPHDPTAIDAPEPWGVLLFPHADLEPSFPGVTTYEQLGWTATGELVNRPVATGAIKYKRHVSKFQGVGFISTFFNGSDQAQGTLTSPAFTIKYPYINFLIGGGSRPYRGHTNATAVLLLVNGTVVDSATGAGNGALNWFSWDVGHLIGQQAQIEIVDESSSGGGRVLADEFLASDSPAHRIPTETTVNLVIDGAVVRSATGQNTAHLAWNAWNVAEFLGKQARIEIVDQCVEPEWGHILVDDIYFSDAPKEEANWIDGGRDFYAVSSWNNVPGDTRRWIGWMSNWDYGATIPTWPWRSAQTIPRDVALKVIDGKVRLIQRPARELRQLRYDETTIQNREINSTSVPLGVRGKALEIVSVFKVGSASEFGLKVRIGQGEETLIGYDTVAGELFVDRNQAGVNNFSQLFRLSENFPNRQTAPLITRNGVVRVHIFVDWSSVEVFGGDGQAVITDQIFPKASSDDLELFAKEGSVKVVSLKIWQLRSILDPR